MTFHSAFTCNAPTCPGSSEGDDENDLIERGWLALQMLDADADVEAHHFCSTGCVRAWLDWVEGREGS